MGDSNLSTDVNVNTPFHEAPTVTGSTVESFFGAGAFGEAPPMFFGPRDSAAGIVNFESRGAHNFELSGVSHPAAAKSASSTRGRRPNKSPISSARPME